MKLSDTKAAYEALSGKASDIVRQLSLAGVGLIWLFKTETASAAMLDIHLLRAALFIFLALFLDFLQYLFGATIWFVYFRYKEKKGTTEKNEFEAPASLNWITWALFYLKATFLLIAYVGYIIPFLASKFARPG
jgi:hypothetical protein